ncbi:MAG: response regulator [Verrucomicrobia bacterium]|nr:response regulator [Verrucomicrobiota bacterium]
MGRAAQTAVANSSAKRAKRFANSRRITVAILFCLLKATAAQTPPADSEPRDLTIRQFLDTARALGEARRVRLAGTVIHSISDRTFFIQEGDAGVYAFHKPERPFRVGERVEVTGYPSLGNIVPTLQHCVARSLGEGALPVPPLLKGQDLQSPFQSMKLVRAQGVLTESSLMQGRRLALRQQDGSPTFEVNMEALPRVDTATQLDQGSLLEVTGVLILRSSGPDAPPAATILARSAKDILLLSGPPIWNLRLVQRTLILTGVALGLALAWVWTLRREVKRKAALIERKFERETALQTQLQQSQKMESLGTLAGGIAHDFNNILSAILGNVELALLDKTADDPAHDCLIEIRKAGLRARELVRQILTFSRKQGTAKKVLALQPEVEEAAKLLRAIIPTAFEITTRIDAHCPPVLSDPIQIQQLLVNLGANAWHAMEGSPGRLTLSLSSIEADSAFCSSHPDLSPGRYACLAISDQGMGMDASTRKRIFEPFFTTKELGKGTGLGLAVVHGIVRDHNGTICVESEQGQGSVFSVYLPVANSPVESPRSPISPPESPSGQGQHILVIDDEESLIAVERKTLERFGYQVTACRHFEEALDLFRANPSRFDLVMTDFDMPGKQGLELIAELRRMRADLPALLVSGNTTEELRSSAAASGVSVVIQKPITADELAQAVHDLLSPSGVAQPPRGAQRNLFFPSDSSGVFLPSGTDPAARKHGGLHGA